MLADFIFYSTVIVAISGVVYDFFIKDWSDGKLHNKISLTFSIVTVVLLVIYMLLA